MNIGISPSANSATMKRVVRLKPKKELHPTIEEKAATRMLLRLARLGSIGFSKRKTVPGKPDAVSLGTKSKNTIHKVYATSSEYAGKQRTIAWKNKSQNNAHQRSPHAMKFEERSHEETEQRCARSKAWNLAKIFTSSKKKTRLHSTFPWRNGYSRLRQQKSRRKESL